MKQRTYKQFGRCGRTAVIRRLPLGRAVRVQRPLAVSQLSESFAMRLVQLPDIQRLPIARVYLPFDAEVLVGSGAEKVGHLVKAIVLVLLTLALASGNYKAEAVQELRDVPWRPNPFAFNPRLDVV